MSIVKAKKDVSFDRLREAISKSFVEKMEKEAAERLS
jgi:hypothetical protein